ncbi:MAG: lipid A export permease/ATP-binding protein MsbA [Ketobacter sp.]|nr:lipid A export permease/ATP-binding protein MsbA [Ketobacter sp.]
MTEQARLSRTSLQTYWRLLGYLSGLRGYFALSVFGFLVFSVSQPMLAKLMELVINAIEHKDADARWVLPFVAVGIFAVRGFGMFMGNYFNEYVGASVIRRIKYELFQHLIVLPARYYDQASQGQLLHRLNSGVHQIQTAVTNALKVLVREGFTIIALLSWAFYLNWRLSLTFLALTPLLVLLVSYSTKRLKKVAKKSEGALGDAMQVSKELISNYGVVRGFGAEKYESQRYGKALDRAFKTQLKIRKISSIFTPLSQLIVASAVAIIIFLLLNPIFLMSSTTGELVGYLTTVALLPKSMQQLSGINVTIQRALVGADLVFSILDVEPEKDLGNFEIQRVQGAVRFDGLCFRYPSSTQDVLSQVSFSVNPGEMVALVGRSGSGKTTLASLLYRLYEVDDGSVFVDDVDVNHYKLTNLRKQIALVSQNVSLFEDTVRNNIAYGDAAYTDEQIRGALLSAHAEDFVNALPQGLDTMIGENGLMLSGGQRQRISIARAFLKDAPILILDEATSALDNESESKITQAIEELADSRTTFVIAHRLSTILKADRLIVMDAGQIVEQGRHDDLLAKGGYYANLYNSELVND